MLGTARSFTVKRKGLHLHSSRAEVPLIKFEKATCEVNEHLTGQYESFSLKTALQPIYSIDHQRCIGYEALIRAEDSNKQSISPLDLFNLPSTEEESIYLDRLCRYIHTANFSKIYDENRWLFINLSAQAYIHSHQYGAFFLSSLKRFGIAPHNVVVEIIEDPTTDNDALLEAAKYYKDMGCLLAIDDFGAGHSNFERVWNLKPDIVKLDRSLITRATDSNSTQNMISSIVDLLHQAGCLVVAEGIETEKQALIASKAGVDFVQGYYFAKPSMNIVKADNHTQLFKQLSRKFINIEQNKSIQNNIHNKDYKQAFYQTIRNLQRKENLAEACNPLDTLPRSIRCFLLSSKGEQLYPTINFNDKRIDTDDKFKQLKTSENANWFRKSYVRSAIKHPHRIMISRPYRSITGDGLCITMSMSFNINKESYIFCYDIMPRDEEVI